MKNKKAAMELSIGTVIIIVVTMCLLILGLIFVRYMFSKPHLTIKEKNCVTEINTAKTFEKLQISIEQTDLLWEISKEIYKSNYYNRTVNSILIGKIFGKYKDLTKKYDSINEFEQACKWADVDKMILYETEIKEICLGDICKEFDTEIFKENLTVDWLDKKCECVEYDGRCPYNYEFVFIPERGYTCWIKELHWNIFGWEKDRWLEYGVSTEPLSKTCQKYKCEFDENKYIVEVK